VDIRYGFFPIKSAFRRSVEYLLSDYSNNILNDFAFFGDAGVTYLVKCREYSLSAQKETTERGFYRKNSVTDHIP
jgi:hypothetical protein